MPHSWPKSFNIGKMQMGPVQANTFHLHRKFTRARHMWLSLKPDWHLLAQNGQECIAMKKSMTDCLPTLVEMTISRMLSRRRHGTRLPIGIGLASVTICGNLLTHGLPLSLSRWKRPLRNIEQTCRWNKLRLQNIQKRMMQPMQNCFGKCERLVWKGLHH